MSNSGGSLKDEAIREIAATDLTIDYQDLGGVMTHYACRIWMTNDTNGDVYVSTDGVTDMKKLPAGSGRAFDDKTNDAFRQKGTQWQVRFASVPMSPAGWFAIEVEYV